jgi:hypothetical protein
MVRSSTLVTALLPQDSVPPWPSQRSCDTTTWQHAIIASCAIRTTVDTASSTLARRESLVFSGITTWGRGFLSNVRSFNPCSTTMQSEQEALHQFKLLCVPGSPIRSSNISPNQSGIKNPGEKRTQRRRPRSPCGRKIVSPVTMKPINEYNMYRRSRKNYYS